MRTLRCILYFEKDIDVRSETIFALSEKGGLDVLSYDCLDDAIDFGDQIHPDLVLLNAEMDGFSVEEILGKLRKFDQMVNIPAVLLTTRPVPDNYLENNNYGVVDVLSKHISGKDLLIRLHEIWGQLSE